MTIKIEKSLVLSSCHLTKEMAIRLADDTDIDIDDFDHTMSIHNMLMVWLKYPQNLHYIRSMAMKHDCTYVKFEVDGPIMDELEVFTW
jgi:hypothetical protein